MEDPDHLYTCIFEDYVDNIPSRKTLIDHILVSSSLSNNRVVHAGVAHDIFMRHTSGMGRRRAFIDVLFCFVWFRFLVLVHFAPV
jgi:hypothetical protein